MPEDPVIATWDALEEILIFCDNLVNFLDTKNYSELSEEFNNNFKARRIGVFLGTLSTVIVTFILGFYSIVAGWVLAFLVDSIFRIFGITTYSAWMTGFSEIRNGSFCVLFLLVTVFISLKGVREGLEKMAKVLSFFFLIILLGLIISVILNALGKLAKKTDSKSN